MCQVMQHYENIARNEGIKEGRIEGIKEGRKEGRLDMLISLVKNGLLKIADAASAAGISEAEFVKLMK